MIMDFITPLPNDVVVNPTCNDDRSINDHFMSHMTHMTTFLMRYRSITEKRRKGMKKMRLSLLSEVISFWHALHPNALFLKRNKKQKTVRSDYESIVNGISKMFSIKLRSLRLVTTLHQPPSGLGKRHGRETKHMTREQGRTTK